MIAKSRVLVVDDEPLMAQDLRQVLSTQGYQVRLGKAAAYFFSSSPEANTVGATASLLLECDEAQDVLEAEWVKKFVPMAAFNNATIVYWGTAWTSRTLLARTIRGLNPAARMSAPIDRSRTGRTRQAPGSPPSH